MPDDGLLVSMLHTNYKQIISDEKLILGKIVKTRNSLTEGLFNLHINFEKISLEMINKIQAEAHNFEDSFQK